jgi:hypothetical protein
MLAMGLEDVQKLDRLLDEPVTQDAERHREAPDEVYQLAERMYEEIDRRRSDQDGLEAPFTARYLN